MGGGGGAAVAATVRACVALVGTSLLLSYAIDAMDRMGIDLGVVREAEAGGSALSLTWLSPSTATVAVLALVASGLLRRLFSALWTKARDGPPEKVKSE